MPSANNSRNKEFLDQLLGEADEQGKIKWTIAELAATHHETKDEIVRRCYHLQKMGVLTFREHHLSNGTEITNLRIRRAFVKKVGKDVVLFDLGLREAIDRHEDTRATKLRQAAQLLEEAMEIELAILVLDAINGNKREYHYASTGPNYLPGSDKKVRILSSDEIRGIDW